MVATVDDFGTWEQLGEVTPNPSTWLEFPSPAAGSSGKFRINWVIPESALKSHCFLREFYLKGNNKISGNYWTSIYPKTSPEIVILPISKELALQSDYLGVEVLQWFPFRRFPINWVEPPYSIRLEELIPYPETLSTINQISLPTSTIEAIATLISDQINQTLPPMLQ